jgi:hypothetical protein
MYEMTGNLLYSYMIQSMNINVDHVMMIQVHMTVLAVMKIKALVERLDNHTEDLNQIYVSISSKRFISITIFSIII